jgi:hypothetical protein
VEVVVAVVTGISPNADTSAVAAALRGASLSLDQLAVFTSGDAPDDQADSGIRFIYSGSDSPHNVIGQTGEITSFGGAEVPGLGPSESHEYFAPESMTSELSEVGIPDGAIDVLVEAIDAGKSIVTYQTHPEIRDAVEQIFRAAGLVNVKTF